MSRALKFLVLLCCLSSVAYARSDITLRAGAGGVEQGDFLLQPSIRASLSYDHYYHLMWDFYGRDYGAVQERTHLLSFAFSPDLTRLPYGLSILFGLSFLDEYTSYTPTNTDNSIFNSTNFGFFTGLHWSTKVFNRGSIDLAWDAAVFPAGMASFYLVTSRKQVLSLSFGWDI